MQGSTAEEDLFSIRAVVVFDQLRLKLWTQFVPDRIALDGLDVLSSNRPVLVLDILRVDSSHVLLNIGLECCIS